MFTSFFSPVREFYWQIKEVTHLLSLRNIMVSNLGVEADYNLSSVEVSSDPPAKWDSTLK
jgi:hypothetical protein